MAAGTDDDASWGQAVSLLGDSPDPLARRRATQRAGARLAVVAVVVLVTIGLALVLVVVLQDEFAERPARPPTWQVVSGFALAAVGLVVQLTGVVLLWRRVRRLGGWRTPLGVLGRRQRKQLLLAVRRRRPLAADRVPLAGLVAEQLRSARWQVVSNVGLGLLFVGLWVSSPSRWRAVLCVAFLVLLIVAVPLVFRDARRADRYLEDPPVAADS